MRLSKWGTLILVFQNIKTETDRRADKSFFFASKLNIGKIKCQVFVERNEHFLKKVHETILPSKAPLDFECAYVLKGPGELRLIYFFLPNKWS